ncbi:MAG: ABC transporter substrate-binding protein, partial [Chloroflexi bacterium]|nr:ABC transporter substrate-binding protein [Chloroflexota bacterium]
QPIQAFAAWYIGEIRELVMRKDVAAAKGVTPKSNLPDKLQALRGLIIAATSPGSGTDYGIRYLLTQYGLDPERDVQITYAGSAKNVTAALRQAAIDVGSVSDEGAVAEYEGFGVILISFTRGEIPETKDKLGTLGIARKDRFGPDQETLEGFTRALWRAQRLMRERPEEAREAAYKSTFAETEAAVFNIKFNQVLATIPLSPEITPQQLKSTVDFRNKTTTEPPVNVAYEDYYYPKIVEAAKKQLGY